MKPTIILYWIGESQFIHPFYEDLRTGRTITGPGVWIDLNETYAA